MKNYRLVYFQTLLIFLIAFMVLDSLVLDVDCLSSSTRNQVVNQHNQERQRVGLKILNTLKPTT